MASLVVWEGQMGVASQFDRIVGSSTLFPLLAAVAEHFYFQGEGTPPLVEPTGTGGGIALFCAPSSQAPIGVSASRPMSQSEKNYCAKQGVDPLEIDLGLDGIVMVHPQADKTFDIKLNHLRQALEDVPSAPMHWKELDTSYPALPIKVLGPSPAAGTYEALIHLLSLKKFRRDGGFRTASDQETILAQKLVIEKNAFGIVSFGFMEKNRHLVFPCKVEGVMPDALTILQGSYPLSRHLYLYINRAKLASNKRMKAFLNFLISDYSVGEKGLFKEFGLVAHDLSYYKKIRIAWEKEK